VDSICLLDILKNDFGEVDEAIFQGVERPWEFISCILGFKKPLGPSYLRAVLSRHMAFCLLDVLKNDFGEFDEEVFQGVESL
jgi:hypothetical protein